MKPFLSSGAFWGMIAVMHMVMYWGHMITHHF